MARFSTISVVSTGMSDADTVVVWTISVSVVTMMLVEVTVATERSVSTTPVIRVVVIVVEARV